MAKSLSTAKINGFLCELGQVYHDAIPLNDIFAKLAEWDLEAVQEDGTPWSGLLCGFEGRAVIELKDTLANLISRRVLVLGWYKMGSGRYELTAYVS